jgi:hypothetical protein
MPFYAIQHTEMPGEQKCIGRQRWLGVEVKPTWLKTSKKMRF